MHPQYQALANAIPKFYLRGKLAEFKYYNIDAIIERALILADQLITEQNA
jgi:UDP-galactopyranose mutase